MEKQVKWKKFRVNKDKIVEKWIKRKRIQKIAEHYVKFLYVWLAIKKSKNNFDKEYFRHQMKVKTVYLSQRITQELRKHVIRRNGEWEYSSYRPSSEDQAIFDSKRDIKNWDGIYM